MTECEYCAPDRLAVAVRKAFEEESPTAAAGAAAAVVEGLMAELPEHFGPEAHSHYLFWLKNRAAALRRGEPFHRWVLTTSYLHYPELMMCDPGLGDQPPRYPDPRAHLACGPDHLGESAAGSVAG